MKISRINLEDRSYDILIDSGIVKNASKHFDDVFKGKKPKLFIVTDENVAKLYLEPLVKNLEAASYKAASIILKAGEATKNFADLEHIVEQILSHQPERSSCIVALGGGVIGDISGFAASIILRGLNFIQIPTSLLAMVDSSVGGKTAVNSKFGKNLIGTFYQPRLVLADLEILKTLPERELQAGYAEIVKYGLIDDLPFFEFLEKAANENKIFDYMSYMVEASCNSKARIVSADEREGGVRALLNLGHTFGHALEAKFQFDGTLLHGEAVAIGMVLAFEFSEFLGICPKGRAERLIFLLKKAGLKTSIADLKTKFTIEELINSMFHDKKVSDGKLTFILANEIGKSFIKKDVAVAPLEEFLKTKI